MPLFDLQKPRDFKIETYYYHPATGDDNKRIHFKRIRKSKRASKTSPFKLLVIIIFLLFLIIYLNKKAHVLPGGDAYPDKIIVEEVIVVD